MGDRPARPVRTAARGGRGTVRLLLAVALLAGVLAVAPTPASPAPTADAALSLSPDPTRTLAAGERHQCAVVADQTVQCWGNNRFGQLGHGVLVDQSLTPVTVDGLTGAVAVTAGEDFTCGLVADGTVRCWGHNDSTQTGVLPAVDNFFTPATVTGVTDVVQLAAGRAHVCALHAAGDVTCWGAGQSGQLGHGTNPVESGPVAVTGLTGVRSIAASGDTSCAIRDDDALYCWGSNTSGQFGFPTPLASQTPVALPDAGDPLDVVVGGAVCVLRTDLSVWCAGSENAGGGGSTAGWVDTGMPPMSHFVRGAPGCAVAPDASLWCWAPTGGLLAPLAGGGEPEPGSELTDVVGGARSGYHTCVALVDGDLRCAGFNIGGQLGTPNLGIARPGEPTGFPNALDVSLTELHTCVLETDGTAMCAGLDFVRLFLGEQVGLDTWDLAGITNATDLAAGSGHQCAIRNDGKVLCRGFNIQGAVGEAPPAGEPIPVVDEAIVVPGLSGVTEVGAGDQLSCAVTVGGSAFDAYCWGDDTHGQLGDGAPEQATHVPSQVLEPLGTNKIEHLSVGATYACASMGPIGGLKVRCWGQNGNGTLGDGTTVDSPSPVDAGSIIGPKDVEAGDRHACAIDSVSKVYCWGSNDYGQLGIGTTSNYENTPQLLPAFPSNPVQLAAGREHTCALLGNQTVWCWGHNDDYQTGAANSPVQLSPKIVPDLLNVVRIDAEGDTTCALFTDQSVQRVRCWGNNLYGQNGISPLNTWGEVPTFTTTVWTGSGPFVTPIWYPVDPARLLETRPQSTTVDGQMELTDPIAGMTQVEIPVAGRAGIPADADFVAVNLTAVRPTGTGYLTAHGCVSPRPFAASLNYVSPPGVGSINIGNEAIVELSDAGTMCVFASTTTDLTVDVTAWGRAAGGYESGPPTRILDSRPGNQTIDGVGQLGARLTAGQQIELQVAGRAGVPDHATSAALYITAVNPSGIGYLTAHPCLPERPLASSLNYTAVPGGGGINRGNEVIAPLSDDGTVCLYVSEETHLTVDVAGSIGPATTATPVAPARIVETRSTTGTVDGQGEYSGPLAGGTEIEVKVAGRAGVPADATAALVNITAVRPSGIGFVTAHPCLAQRPLASSLNFAAPPLTGPINGGNEVLAPLSSSGTVCLYVSATTHLTVDVVGAT